ncbi:uncharacterized protein VTP21DRAFT_6389 [Calcarisporiella thermophila]|uniref:uncharacterized protein n=1 Tax=Calcarisporiella thermophila TaxID=911321 RepID=UPI0037434CD9
MPEKNGHANGAQRRSILIFSGGSACNYIVQQLQALTPDVAYVLGVSDNGGSTSEILRVVGGPSIGDLRSRLTRLIDTTRSDSGSESQAIKDLLSYRLPATCDDESRIKAEWHDIVEGRHQLWSGISAGKRETIRGFLSLFHFEILKRAHKKFDYRNGSIGNFFLTGARLFFNSLEAAIFLFAAITGISDPTTVVPVINTNHMVTIAASLENGENIVGQCEISHPSSVSGSGNILFDKRRCGGLPARIKRIFYMNEYGAELFPHPNTRCLQLLATKRTLIYSIGSLYTSIMPCLVLRKIGNAIASSPTLRRKILILNGSTDRETTGYTALDFVQAITDGLNFSRQVDMVCTCADESLHPPTASDLPAITASNTPALDASAFLTHLIYLDNSAVPVPVEKIENLGINCVPVRGAESNGVPVYVEEELSRVLEALVE